MKNSVIIKSLPSGIVLHLDDKITFEQLLFDIAIKFKESGHFFKDATMALSLKGRTLTEEEEKKILDVISDNSDIHIACLVGEDKETEKQFVKALSQCGYSSEENIGCEGQFYRGTLKNGQILETESSIVILGDVYPGSAIISSKNIIILGGLYGEAYAGGNGDMRHYVAALEMSPEKLKIGDFKYISKEKNNKWSIKPKVHPKIAYVKDNKIVTDSLTKELLGELPV